MLNSYEKPSVSYDIVLTSLLIGEHILLQPRLHHADHTAPVHQVQVVLPAQAAPLHMELQGPAGQVGVDKLGRHGM
jgi:hypothetical protein